MIHTSAGNKSVNIYIFIESANRVILLVCSNGRRNGDRAEPENVDARNTTHWRWPAGGGRGTTEGVPRRGEHQRPL